MSSHAEPKHADAQHGSGHHRNYVKIWAILLALLLISVFGPFLGIRVVTLLTAFGVAVVKAYMVAKNFMHLDVEKRIVKWALAVVVIFMVMLFAGVSPDVMMDGGHQWEKDAGFHPVESAGHGAGHDDAGHDDAATQGGAGHDATGSESGGHETPGAAGTPAGADSTGPEDGAEQAPEGSTSDGH